MASSTYHFKPFWVRLCYSLIFSFVGYLALRFSKPRIAYKLEDLDLFFTSVSAVTVSSMSTVEMEVFSNAQLIILTVLISFGSEIYISFLGLLIKRFVLLSAQEKQLNNSPATDFVYRNNKNGIVREERTIELDTITLSPHPLDRDKPLSTKYFFSDDHEMELHYDSIKTLGYVVLWYFLVIHIIGLGLIYAYISFTPSAHNVLKGKGLAIETFSIFTTVATFTNCGFIPTNENMMVFRKNSGLLLILIPQVLLGNTLYAPCLRLVIQVLERLTRRREYTYILKNHRKLGYAHLMSSKKSWFLTGTVLVLLMVQFVAFSIMEWNSGVMEGMNSHEKLVGSLFQCTNSRHTGESIVDLSSVSSAILVLFVIMMYLPSYPSFLPIRDQQEEASENKEGVKNENKNIVENIVFSRLSFLAIFVFVICITERKSLKEDPLNFNILSIVVEVVSAYGNVGFSMGYSCKRRVKLGNCDDKWFGFAGRWSKQGKLSLILVMLFGRLKKFSMYDGKAWTVL